MRSLMASADCYHCEKDATISCIVPGARMFLQLVCDDHLPENAEVLLRKEDDADND